MLVTAFAAAVQGAVGAGYAIVAVPILALVDADLAPVPQLLGAVPLAVAMMWRERGHIDVRGIRWIIAGRIPGVFLGVWILAVATRRATLIVISLLILAMVGALALGLRIARKPTTEFAAGVAASIASVVASVGGPPQALLYRDDRGPVIRSTLAALFTFGLSLSIIARAFTGNISGNDLRIGAVLLVPTIVGLLISTRILHRIEDRQIRVTILVVSAFAALALLVRTLAG